MRVLFLSTRLSSFTDIGAKLTHFTLPFRCGGEDSKSRSTFRSGIRTSHQETTIRIHCIQILYPVQLSDDDMRHTRINDMDADRSLHMFLVCVT